MEFNYTYNPVKFLDCLSDIKKSMPSLEEMINFDIEKFDTFLKKVVSLSEKDFELLAPSMSSKELEFILFIIKNKDDTSIFNKPFSDNVIAILEKLLVLRFRKKLFDLCWIMFQTDYPNAGLIHTLGVLVDCLKERFPEKYSLTAFYRLDIYERFMLDSFKRLLIEDKTDIKTFHRKYSIILQSDFSRKICNLFFIDCEAKDYYTNRDMLCYYFVNEENYSAANVFSSYLMKLEPVNYIDAVNNTVLSKWGNPEAGEMFWGEINEECKKRFVSWQDLKRIELYFGRYSKKYKLWIGYFDKMSGIYLDSDYKLLVMFFDSFTVLDIKDDEEFLYFYDRKFFKIEFSYYESRWLEGEAAWRLIPKQIIEARELVIDGIKSKICRVGYNRAQVLYLKEILKTQFDNTVKDKYFV